MSFLNRLHELKHYANEVWRERKASRWFRSLDRRAEFGHLGRIKFERMWYEWFGRDSPIVGFSPVASLFFDDVSIEDFTRLEDFHHAN